MTTIAYRNVQLIVPTVYKVTKSDWAEKFIENGVICFSDLEVFRKDEDIDRGDNQEGIFVQSVGNAKYSSSYMNKIFVWCATTESDPRKNLRIWKDRDTVIEITDLEKLLLKIEQAVSKKKLKVQISAGFVSYDKDKGGNSPYCWEQGIYQKNIKYSHQKEFRIALVALEEIKQENIILKLGCCKDIARITYSKKSFLRNIFHDLRHIFSNSN